MYLVLAKTRDGLASVTSYPFGTAKEAWQYIKASKGRRTITGPGFVKTEVRVKNEVVRFS